MKTLRLTPFETQPAGNEGYLGSHFLLSAKVGRS